MTTSSIWCQFSPRFPLELIVLTIVWTCLIWIKQTVLLMPDADCMGPREQKSPYLQLGGEKVLRVLVDRFFRLMDKSPQFASVRATQKADQADAKEALFDGLAEWLGGPPYFQDLDHRCVISSHFRAPLSDKDAGQWLTCMRQALVQVDAPKEFLRQLEIVFCNLAEHMSLKGCPTQGKPNCIFSVNGFCHGRYGNHAPRH